MISPPGPTRQVVRRPTYEVVRRHMNVYAHVSLDNQRAALDLLNAQLVDASEGAP